jgi:hypothetical protein
VDNVSAVRRGLHLNAHVRRPPRDRCASPVWVQVRGCLPKVSDTSGLAGTR